MRHIIHFAVAVLVVGGYAARFADTAMKDTPQAATVQQYEPRQPVHSGRSLTLDSGRGGHFQVDARIAGRDIAFMVDTGASQVIVHESDAAKIGIRPMRSDFTYRVSTANGTIKAAPTTIDRIEIGGITVFDVKALVLPDEALRQNLLGMSFLSRLKRYEVANGRMILED
jgi:aspartyl protease family protein